MLGGANRFYPGLSQLLLYNSHTTELAFTAHALLRIERICTFLLTRKAEQLWMPVLMSSFTWEIGGWGYSREGCGRFEGGLRREG